jgi:hypothetical protein
MRKVAGRIWNQRRLRRGGLSAIAICEKGRRGHGWCYTDFSICECHGMIGPLSRLFKPLAVCLQQEIMKFWLMAESDVFAISTTIEGRA